MPAIEAALAIVLVAAAFLFVDRASVSAWGVNTKISRTDQGAYIKQAMDLKTADADYVSPRNRMPMYPGLLALFMDREQIAAAPDRDAAALAFFDTGKRINISLGLATAIFAGAVFFLKFPRHHALNLTIFAAFGVLVFKAAHVQAEILYYAANFAAFLLCWRLFRRPSWWLAILAGGVIGFAHLTKASVLPGLLVVAVFLPLDALWSRWKGKPALPKLVATALLAAAFLAAVFPYISTSKKVFGHYFYNVNSTFYMWTDSWKEAVSRTRAAGDRKGWPDLPADQLPSLSNYFKTHSAGEATWRVVKGISVVFQSMRQSYGYLWICVAYLSVAGFLCAVKWRLVWRVVRARPAPFLALLAYFFGYYLLYAWYSPIIQGNRFVLALFLPFLFSVSDVIVALGPRIPLPRLGPNWSALSVFNCAMSVWIAVEVGVICLARIPTLYGGG